MSSEARLYATLLGIAGIGVLIDWFPPIRGEQVLPLVLLTACSVFFEIHTVMLPSGQHLSLSGAFGMVALVLWGPGHAILVEAGSGLAGSRDIRPLGQWALSTAYNLGQYTLAAAAMGYVYVRVAGTPGGLGFWSLAGLAAGTPAYLAVNLGLLVVMHWLHARRSPLAVIRGVLGDGLAGFASSALFAVPLAFALDTGGWLNLLVPVFFLMAFRYAINLYLRQKRTYFDTLEQVITARTASRGPHALQVAALARGIARRLKLPAPDQDLVHAAALLHDIGELKVDERVVAAVYRSGILTVAETRSYQGHAGHGAEALTRIAGMERAALAVRHHHEHWDGSGYPDGLKGKEIPLLARIIGAAEAYAMSVLPDPPLSPAQQEARVRRLSGRVIDPDLAGPLLMSLVDPADRPGALLQEELREEVAVGRVQEALRESEILSSLGLGQILRYQGGRFSDYSGHPAQPPQAPGVQELADQAVVQGRPLREQLVDGARGAVLDVYCVPLGASACTVLIFDVTHVLDQERQQRRRIQRAYGDVMAAVTRGKLRLVDEEGRDGLFREGEPLGMVELDDLAKVPACREVVELWGGRLGLTRAVRFQLALCASEAASNVFKHAGTGVMELRILPRHLRVLVRDNGSGIALDLLPRAVLVDGFSTKISLGKGFKLMLHYMERVWIHSSPDGTLVALDIPLTGAGQEEQRHPDSPPGSERPGVVVPFRPDPGARRDVPC